VISVDSALVYRGMDIGTAKPTPAERAAVPHHLIDILEPTEPIRQPSSWPTPPGWRPRSAQRGRLPLLVGGTMLYFKACAKASTPCRRPTRRCARAGRTGRRRGLAGAARRTGARGPGHRGAPAPADSQRIQRALEVWQV
jgi:tRNA dimethylallyltransferase